MHYVARLNISVPFEATVIIQAPDDRPLAEITTAIEKTLSQNGYPGIEINDEPWQVQVVRTEPISGGKPDVVVSIDGETVQAKVVKAR